MWWTQPLFSATKKGIPRKLAEVVVRLHLRKSRGRRKNEDAVSRIAESVDRQYTIHISVKNRRNTLLVKYQLSFKEELGIITEGRAKRFLKFDMKPRFLKVANVPFALQKAIGTEVAKME